MNIFKQKKGITSSTLVITIIVLLILISIGIAIAIKGKLINYFENVTVETKMEKTREQNIANLQDGLSTDNLIDRYTIE